MQWKHYRRAAVAAVLVASWAGTAAGQSAPSANGSAATPAPQLSLDPFKNQGKGGKLAELSLEDLMNIEVTSVSRQKQRVGDAAAAVYVIGQDDIHRSGMTAIPELLRMVPGLSVRQMDPGQWSVGSRGFSGLFTNNLLVLMDGRTVYTPLFGGVIWDQVDYPLNDLERIEVVRGPGSTLWGSNAVNGVINIISKSAEATQGAALSDYTGTDGYIGSARYGGNIDNRIFYRVYSEYRSMNDMPDPAHSQAVDGWDSLRNGFRVDAHLSEADLLTVQGDYFSNRAGLPTLEMKLTAPYTGVISPITDSTGGNLLARFTHTVSEDSDWSVQMYFDQINHFRLGNNFEQSTFDLEFQQRFRVAGMHEIIWGGGYRLVADQVAPAMRQWAEGNYMDPESRDNSQANLFVQDEMTLVPEKVHAIIGAKLELTPYTGLEVQPSARLLYTPDAKNTLWLSASRAVRSPSRAEEDAHMVTGVIPMSPLPVVVALAGSREIKSEELLAFEGGYRTEPAAGLSLDLSTFLNVHRNLMEYRAVGEPAVAFAPSPHLVQTTMSLNAAQGISYGAELSAKWKASDQLTVSAGYSYVGISLRSTMPGNDQGETARLEGTTPAHQGQFHVAYDITKNLQVNAATYLMGTAGVPHIGAYVRQDLNVSWRFDKHAELMIGVRNLFDGGHVEFLDPMLRGSANEVPRTFFISISGSF